jgi:hypothetical protein
MLYNVIEKLRRRTPLEAKERAVHEAAACGGLRDLHDALDVAVAGAYGWAWPDQASVPLAFALRHLTTLPLLVGTVVHQAARQVVGAVVGGTPVPSYDDLLGGARFTLNHAWRSSLPPQSGRFWRQPTLAPLLQEVIDRGYLEPREIARMQARLTTCLHTLLVAPVLADVADAGRDATWLPPLGPVRFQPTPGQTVWGAVDLAYRHHDAAGLMGALEAAAGSVGPNPLAAQAMATARLLEAMGEASEPSRP